MVEKEKDKSESRKWGIDLLRILAMLFVVGLHFNQNCCFENLKELNFSFVWCWLLEGICYTGVDVFVLITGFLRGGNYPALYSFRSRRRLYGIIITVYMYSIIFFIMSLLVGSNGGTNCIASLMPITSGSYWFISTYLLLMIVEPILFLVIRSGWFHRIYIMLIIVFCVVPTLIPTAGLDLKPSGVSLVWFGVLYLSGYLLQSISLKRGKAFALFFISISVPVSVKVAVKWLFGRDQGGAVFYHHNSLLIFGAACLLLLIFKDIVIKKELVKKILLYLSEACIGVYLIHDNAYVRSWVWGFVSERINYDFLFFAITSILVIIGIFAVCCIIDMVRLTLFRMLKFEHFADFIDKVISICVDRISMSGRKIMSLFRGDKI